MKALRGTTLLLLGLVLFPATAPAQDCNTADRSVLLILDASGSMNAKLPNGEARIAVARRAIKDVATLLPGEAQLSLRLYGSQSPREDHNCQALTLPFPLGWQVRAAMRSRPRSMRRRRKVTPRLPSRSNKRRTTSLLTPRIA